MGDNKNLKWWLRLIKRVTVVVILLVLIGLGLYYTAVFDTYAPEANKAGMPRPDGSWGIFNDSPIRRKY